MEEMAKLVGESGGGGGGGGHLCGSLAKGVMLLPCE